MGQLINNALGPQRFKQLARCVPWIPEVPEQITLTALPHSPIGADQQRSKPLIGIGDFLNASAMLRGIKARSETAPGGDQVRKAPDLQ